MGNEEKNKKRRFSLESPFMKYNIDDILFGAMYYHSTFHPEEKLLYLTKKNYTKYKDVIKKVCDVTTQTLNNHLQVLINNGLIKETEIKIGEIKTPVYIFPYTHKEKYQLVDNEMLWYIVSTRSQQAIKLYIYLLDKYKWKTENNDQYIFTNTELLSALGYSTNSSSQRANAVINNILESFAREGVIKFENFYEEVILNSGKTVPAPRKRLTFVAQTKNELPKLQ